MSWGVGCGVGRCLDPLTDGSDLQHALREEETERQRTRIGVKVEKGIRVSGCEGLGFRGWGGGSRQASLRRRWGERRQEGARQRFLHAK